MTKVVCISAKDCTRPACPHKTPHEPHKKWCECGYCGTMPCNYPSYCSGIREIVQCVETEAAE